MLAQQRKGDGALARPDLDQMLAGARVHRLHDAVDVIPVGKKVLAKRLLGRCAERRIHLRSLTEAAPARGVFARTKSGYQNVASSRQAGKAGALRTAT